MFRRVRILRMIGLGILFSLMAEAGDTNVQFKPRDYKPSKTLRANTYEPKADAPKPQTSSKQFDSSTPSDFKTFSSTKALSDKTLKTEKPFEAKAMEKLSTVDAKAYTPNAPLFPSTISADNAIAAQEKKPFLVSTNASPFLVTERPNERNPLLEPKQGIKAPEETTPTKEQTP